MKGHDGQVVVKEYQENFPSKGICGGTGQFKNAEGYMDLSGHPDPKNSASLFVVEMGVGEIFNVENSK